jgi:hypothetical protein
MTYRPRGGATIGVGLINGGAGLGEDVGEAIGHRQLADRGKPLEEADEVTLILSKVIPLFVKEAPER